MSFKDMVEADNLSVFLNPDEFGEERDIKYDGVTYAAVSCVLTKLKEKDRNTTMSDHAQGIYRVDATFHCRLADIGGIKPEKGGQFLISDDGFMQRFFVGESGCSMGMVRLELEALDE